MGAAVGDVAQIQKNNYSRNSIMDFDNRNQ